MQLVFTDYPNHAFSGTSEPEFRILARIYGTTQTKQANKFFSGHFMHDCVNIPLDTVYINGQQDYIVTTSSMLIQFPVAAFPSSHLLDGSCAVEGINFSTNMPV